MAHLERAHLTLPIVCACATILSAPAFAGQCPSGQIFRVSKGVCVDRAEAIKDGVIGAAKPKAAKPTQTAYAAKSRSVAEDEGQTAIEKSIAPAPQKALTRSVELRRPAAQAAEAPAAKPPSPYGALRLDYFGPR